MTSPTTLEFHTETPQISILWQKTTKLSPQSEKRDRKPPIRLNGRMWNGTAPNFPNGRTWNGTAPNFPNGRTIKNRSIMLEMIPREFWRTIYVELSAIDWDAITAEEEREREQHRQELAARYDAAILAKQKAQRHKSNDNDRRREQIRIASKRYKEKSKRPIK